MGKYFSAVVFILLTATFNANSAWTAEPTWSYQGDTGPKHWGKLSEDYLLCQQGVNQSPIDILDTTFDRLFSLGFIYKDVPLQIARRNHTLEVDYGTPINNDDKFVEISGQKVPLPTTLTHDSTLNISGETYTLKKISFHAPSEHSYEHKSYPMEVQLHHKNEYQQWAILSIFFKTGKSNALIEKLWQHIPSEPETTHQAEALINAKDILPKRRGYYHYRGSLTIPPCNEGVRWFVFKEPNSLSKAQLKTFTQQIKPNNRPQQAKNHRFLLESL